MDVSSNRFSLLWYFVIPKKGSGGTGTMHNLTWALAADLFNKHQILICCLKYLQKNIESQMLISNWIVKTSFLKGTHQGDTS